MQIDGELKIESVRQNYRSQIKKMIEQKAIEIFQDALLGMEPDELSLTNYLVEQTEKGNFKSNLVINMSIKEENDGIVIVWCDDNGDPLKID